MHETRTSGDGFAAMSPSAQHSRHALVALLFALLLTVQWQMPAWVGGQEVPATTDEDALREAESKFNQAMADTDANAPPVDEAVAKASPDQDEIRLISLVFKGGWLMVPPAGNIPAAIRPPCGCWCGTKRMRWVRFARKK